MILWCLSSKVRVEREDEREEIRWKLWEREKVMPVGETDGGAGGWGDRGHCTE